MRPGCSGLLARLIIALLLQVCIVATEARAQTPDLLGLMQRIGELSKAGRYKDAIPLGQQLVAEAEQWAGKEHPLAAIAVFTLAELHRLQGQLDVAEPMLKRVLAVREKTFGSEHRDVAPVLASLSYIAIDRAHYIEAEQYLLRVLAIRQRELGNDDPDVTMTLLGIGRVRHRQARYGEAEALFQQAVEAFRKSLGPDHTYVSVALNNLAEVYKEQGRLIFAERRLREALAIQEKVYGPDRLTAAAVANNLGELHVRQGRYAEAEALYRRTLQISEKALGPDHPDVANQLSNLATLFTHQGRASESEGLLRRALAITEKAFGPDHPDVAVRTNNLAHAISAQGQRSQEAEALYRRSLAIREAHFGGNSVSVAIALDNLVALLHQGRRFAEAEPLARRSLAIREHELGAEHPLMGNSLNNLANTLDNLQRHDEAEPLLRRALEIREAALGAGHPDVAVTVHNLASHYLDLHDWDAAYVAFKRASAIWVGRRGSTSGALADGQQTEMRTNADPFLGLIVAAYHMSETADEETASKLRAEAFESAQWVVGASAASAIGRMSVRFASSTGQLAELVRERQDLAEQVAATDRALIAAASQSAEMRNSDVEMTLLGQAATNATRLKDIDVTLAARFPQYATLTNVAPVPLVDAGSLIRPDEALLLIVPTKDDTYLWAVTSSQTRWIKIALGSKALTDHVKALRCGLDYAGEWQDDGTQRCAELVGPAAALSRDTGFLPFDLIRAHQLYRALFGQIQDLISGKHLQIVASGALASIPFHVLVASEPAADALGEQVKYARADWLVRRTAISVLPSVASLKSLRGFAYKSEAPAPFIGFGNPLLLGRDGADRRAWARQSCSTTGASEAGRVGNRNIAKPAYAILRGALADTGVLRQQAPLPETADELCTVARLLGAPNRSVHLGANATERSLKALSASGELRRARIVHFATHGLLARETEGIAQSRAEPALMLTPPQQASEEDDGLLTASEVAQLKLDADWVVLSACNTAAGDKADAEALSGLARAFFYAGSRALLVSHWYVDSNAAVATTNGVFAELKKNPSIGRAEALRRSMLALIDKGGRGAHPAYWAPFVVVGEGGATGTPAGSPIIMSAAARGEPGRRSEPSARRAARAKKATGSDWRSEIWKQ